MAEPGAATGPGRATIAPAKINLYLHVTGRREDGFHLLDSLAAFAGIQDAITVSPAQRLTLDIDGPLAGVAPAGDDNLVLKAARALQGATGGTQGAAIRLTKRLPAAAGLGGGSADAAAALKALNVLWQTGLDAPTLAALGLRLGADVPVCLFGRAAFMGGIGEELAPAPALPTAWVVLVNPGVGLSTPAVFAKRAELSGETYSAQARFEYAPGDAAELAAVLGKRRNDLEDAAVSLEPAVGRALAALESQPGTLLARMSGSGATCFGLFPGADDAARAAMALSAEHPGWWVKPASLEADTGRIRA